MTCQQVRAQAACCQSTGPVVALDRKTQHCACLPHQHLPGLCRAWQMRRMHRSQAGTTSAGLQRACTRRQGPLLARGGRCPAWPMHRKAVLTGERLPERASAMPSFCFCASLTLVTYRHPSVSIFQHTAAGVPWRRFCASLTLMPVGVTRLTVISTWAQLQLECCWRVLQPLCRCCRSSRRHVFAGAPERKCRASCSLHAAVTKM